MTVFNKSPELAQLEDSFSYVSEIGKANPEFSSEVQAAVKAIGDLWNLVAEKERRDYTAKHRAEVDAYWGRVTETAYGK